MGSLAMLEKPRCSHRSMDAGSPAGHPWVIGSAQKTRILWANWVREWWTQLDCVFFTDVLMRDSPIAPTSWIELLPTRGGNVVIFVIINVLHLLWKTWRLAFYQPSASRFESLPGTDCRWRVSTLHWVWKKAMACDNDSDLLCCPKDEAMQLNIVHRHFIQSESALADWTLKEMDRNGWITLKYHGRNASRMHTQWVSKTIAITAMIQETKQKKRFEKPLCHFFSPFVTFLGHRVSGKSSDRFSFGGSLSQPQCLSRLQTVGGAIGSRSTVAEGSPMTHSFVFFWWKKSWESDGNWTVFFWKMCVCVCFFVNLLVWPLVRMYSRYLETRNWF